jgi:Kdo2-lipid IVA lauroyltransferase/acyltransferase
VVASPLPRKRSALRNALEAGLAHVLVSWLEYAPRPIANRLGIACARVLDVAIPRLRRIAYRNLALAYPDSDTAWRQRTVDGVFASVGRLLVAFARFPEITKANVAEWIGYEGFQHYRRAKERGKGVLFATAHLGNWELSAYAHALLTEPMNVVVRPLDNPAIDAMVERRRALSGNNLLSKRDFARSIFHALRANEPVGILVDQNSSADNGAFVPFFGMPACANLTFAKLAARSGAAVIPGFAIWNERTRRYVLHFYPEVEITGDPVEDTRRIQSAIETAIRETPDQWLWIHRRWKTRPDGEASLYKEI